MFALQSIQNATPGAEEIPSYTPNILPCRVHHDGPVGNLQRYWKPTVNEIDKCRDSQTAHFRGRKLRGRRVALPEGYHGVVATPTDRVLPSSRSGKDLDSNNDIPMTDGERDEPVKVLEKQATFQEFVVWGHEVLPTADDPFIKGVEEWIQFAEAMHSTTVSDSDGKEHSN